MAESFASIRSESGLVTAEFAVAIPAVLAVLLVALTAISGQVQAARLQQYASVVAHSFARSEPESEVKSWLQSHAPKANLTTSQVDGVLCATLGQSLKFVISLDALFVSETACVWIGQRVSDG